MQIRKANVDDAASIAKVYIDSWKTTYSGILPDEFLQTLTYEPKKWREQIVNQPIHIAEDKDGYMVGFAMGGKERTGKYAGYDGELYAIYLLEDYQRKGIGNMLFQKVVEQLYKDGVDTMIVMVLADNPAKHFYEAMGGSLLQRTKLHVGGHELPTLVYGWKDISIFTQ